jgi:N utilization substance protein B
MTAAGERRGGRPKARDLVMRVLYEADITGDSPVALLDLAFGRYRFSEDGRAYARRLVTAFLEHHGRVDATIREHLEHWHLERLGTLERAILRLATVELLCFDETPARVALDEALRLSHRYCDPASRAFVNGVLDPIARRSRGEELPTRPPERGSSA